MTAVTVGSLCTGIAGLEHGLTLAGLDTDTVFVSDIDKGACTWLEANVTAPNLGDFTALDELPPVDILTAGFPCQPLSLAGQRKGVNDERWLFDDICRLVGRMGSRPVLFLENVPGLLSANNGDAMARVVHGLAGIGYSITWGTMAAADLGAPHRRLRWWAVAWHTENVNQKWRIGCSNRFGQAPASVRGTSSNRTFADADSARQQRRPVAVTSEPRHDRLRGDSVSAAGRERLDTFGAYAPAVQRWEQVMGRSAPEPMIDRYLSAAFTEWLMGYPEGWVTDTLTNRRHALHALGNAVVPQCAAAAFTALAARVDDQAADGKSQTPAARSLTRW